MNLPNSYFEDFPIEFKEINPEDFPGFEIENDNKKVIIEPNDEGYIGDAFQAEINLRSKNTVVVNAAVGQGKSTAIIKTIGRYYREHPDTIIIVATPFVSLVEQYCNDIHTGANVPTEQIYNYGSLGRNNEIDYKSMRVQVLTVNTLLGNPGEDAFKNSDIKRTYLNTLITHCRENDLKVVFIYDEIHDAIQNFKQEYIFGLWKWREVILKNYVLSATYNEASKIVIEYLAELTDKKITIIESRRALFPSKQSKLYLHFSPSYNFTNTTPEFVNVVFDLVSVNKNIDVLCYSKNLAKSIIKANDGVGKLLKDKYGTLNDCTSELITNQRPENEPPNNRFNNEKCNVGTNFKTGVSILKENHAYIIVLPPRATRLWFRNKYGIFSQGIISIIQALARQRTNGDIHIILPRPDRFNYSSLTHAGFDENQIDKFSEAYNTICHDSEYEVNYYSLDSQDYILLDFYKSKLLDNVSGEIGVVKSLRRENLASLKFPDFKSFKLEKGEDYLANTIKFYGEDVASYLTYCAFTNQIVNCKLEGITYKSILYFTEGNIQKELKKYFYIYFGEIYYDLMTTVANFNMLYQDIRTKLFSEYALKYKASTSPNFVNITEYHKHFENQLLRFCGIIFFQNEYYYKDEITNREIDIEYTRGRYFQDTIATALTFTSDQINFSDEVKRKVKAYQNLNFFRTRIISKITQYSRGEISYNYLPITPPAEFFSPQEKASLDNLISELCETDNLLKHDVFNFRRNFLNSQGLPKSVDKRIESLYKVLLSDFFESPELAEYPRIVLNGQTRRVKPIVAIYPLPNPGKIIDILTPKAENTEYQQEIRERSEIEFGSYEAYLAHMRKSVSQL